MVLYFRQTLQAGKIYDALKVAADKVEIEGVSAKDALDEAQKTAEDAMSSVSK